MKPKRKYQDPEKEIQRLNELLEIIYNILKNKSLPYGKRNDEAIFLIENNQRGAKTMKTLKEKLLPYTIKTLKDKLKPYTIK